MEDNNKEKRIEKRNWTKNEKRKGGNGKEKVKKTGGNKPNRIQVLGKRHQGER